MSEFEGLPVALLEAMAAGVVSVMRAIERGVPELVHHERTGSLVGNDPAEAAAALVRLSRDPELWQRCSTQSRVLVEAGYGAVQCFERWLAVMEQQRSPARSPFPIRTSDLRRLLPNADSRFQLFYRSSPFHWSRLHPRRLLGRLRRGVARITMA
jgi:colanic acid/amylovoran biosynthesis glycosyltransferase